MFRFLQQQIARLFRALSELGAAIVWPIERMASAMARAALSGSEGVDRLGGFFGRIVMGITWPLRATWRVVAGVANALVPQSVRERCLALGDWFFRLQRRFLAGILSASEALNLDRLVLWLVWLLQPLWRPLVSLGGFVRAWFVTRAWRQMVWGVPAVLIFLPFAMVGAHTLWVGNGAIVSQYRHAVTEALEARDYNRVQLYERKLAQLGVDTQLTEYRTAVAFAEEEKLEEAYERMQRLAPADRPGYPQAHFWIIQRLLSGQLAVSQDEARSLAKVHLDHLETLEMKGPYQQFLLGLWLAQGKQLDEAASVFEPLVSAIPNAAFERLRIDLALNRPEQAREDARALVTHMSARTRRGAELGTTDYQWWLAAEEVLGNWEKMRTILDQWHKLEPENEQARKALATVCRRQAAKLLRDPLPNQQKIVTLWLDAAELDQSNESLLQLASILYRDRELAPIYESVLTELLESPRTPASLLVAVGTEAAKQQNFDEARQFLGTAAARDETDPIAWNNYAWVLGEGENPQLDEALVAVNRALEFAPNEHRYRETRGQILLRLERWQEAVQDLEFAINGLPELGSIHESLATAYAALGQEELAQLHQLQAEGP